MQTALSSLFESFQATSDPKFFAATFARYCESKAEAAQNVNTFLSDLEWDEDDDVSMIDYITAKLNEYGLFYNSMVSGPDGWVRLGDLAEAVILEQNNIDGASEPEVESFDSNMEATEAQKVTDVVRWTLNSTTDVQCLAAALSASAATSTIADAAAMYDATVAAKNLTNGLTDSAGYYKEKLLQFTDPSALIVEIFNKTGCADVLNATANSPFSSLSSTEVGQYNGASPVGPLDFSGVAETVNTVCKVGSKIFGTIAGLVGAGVKNLWNKTAEKVNEIFVDPLDLVTLDPSDPNRCIKFGCYQSQEMVPNSSARGFNLYFDPEEVDVNTYKFEVGSAMHREWRSKTLNRTATGPLYVRTLFGNIGIQVPSDLPADTGWNVSTLVVNSADNGLVTLVPYLTNGTVSYPDRGLIYSFMPSIVNPSVFESIWENHFKFNYDLSHTCQGIQVRTVHASDATRLDFLREVADRAGELTNITGCSEVDLYKGLVYGHYMLLSLRWFAGDPTLVDNGKVLTDIVHWTKARASSLNTVTNRMFLYASSLMDSDGTSALELEYDADELPFPMPAPTITGDINSVGNTTVGQVAKATGLLYTNFILWQTAEEVLFPADFGYAPYSFNVNELGEFSYRMATDSENQDAVNKILTTVIIASAVAIIGFKAARIFKKKRVAKAWKREQTLATTQSKMWNGEPLSPKEMKAYRKAVKKGGVASLFDQSLPAPTSGDTNNVNDNYEHIMRTQSLITG